MSRYGRAAWRSDEELLSRPSRDKSQSSYPKAELDSMTSAAEQSIAVAAARCPIATALLAEITELLRYEYEIQRFQDRFGLLAAADRVCFDAQQAGLDLDLAGDGLLAAWDVAQIARYAREEM